MRVLYVEMHCQALPFIWDEENTYQIYVSLISVYSFMRYVSK